MGRLWSWLKDEPKGFFAICGFVFFIIVFTLAWNVAMDFIVQFFGVQMGPSNDKLVKLLNAGLVKFIFVLFFAAATEEIIFRVPLIFILDISDYRPLLIFGVLASSAVFGFLHGGLVNILFQGAGGVIFSVAFLKGGAINDNLGKGFFIATFTHLLLNVVITVIQAVYQSAL